MVAKKPATKVQKPVAKKAPIEVVEIQPIAREEIPQVIEEEILVAIESTEEEIPVVEETEESPCFLGAIRGFQADTEFFVVQLRIDRLRELLTFAEKNVPAPEKMQREVKGTKVKAISEYVRANRCSYILPAVTVVIDGDFSFEPFFGSECGKLSFAPGTKLFPLDGQHRLLGLQTALNEMEDLGIETIAATLHKRDSLLERRQAFHDINKYATPVPSGLAKSMDHRNPGTNLVSHVISQDSDNPSRILVFARECINYNKASLTGKSPEIFPYKTLQEAIEFSRKLIKYDHLPNQITVVRQYWQAVSEAMTDWKENPVKVREHTIATHSITIKALGRLGEYFLASTKEFSEKKMDVLQKLSLIDWSKGNTKWQEIGVLDTKGKIIASGADDRICKYLVEYLGIPQSKIPAIEINN
ncbi:DNA sulfur modification protein DndB [Microcoleus sp. herbarium7]|uniref:DNA sulfur modification protein DndB n=1 Tax=Microcoleus sp. herbarium7 TaxID=3055435 RepID=UPI002FD47364